MKVVEIDGSMGEGGGQILRYSLSLSALTLRPVKVYNIRAKRSNPGLRPQHLTAVRALASVTDAYVEGGKVGSTEIYFEPRRRRGGSYSFNIGTAGSISLVIQAIMPALLFSDKHSRVEIIGGTDVSWSPPIDYMRHVFLYNLSLLGVNAKLKVYRRGHYPRGGGKVLIEISPAAEPLKPVHAVLRGKIVRIRGISHAVRLPRHVAQRQASSAAEYIKKEIGIEPEIEIEAYEGRRDPHLGPGSGILVYAEVERGTRIGADSLGAKGKPAETVGREAGEKLVEELRSNMAFDRHMGDMLIPYLFLASGESIVGVSSLTMHTITAIEVAKKFLPEAYVRIQGSTGEPAKISVAGVGFSP